jgi:transposase
VKQEREEYRKQTAQLDARDFVFIDETGIDTRLVRRYARASGGARAHGSVPFGSYERLTVLGALSLEGLLAPMTTKAATDTDVFLAYLDQVLIPELVAKKPGATVIMDNLKPHRAVAVKEKLEAAGLKLRYLPPYSPDFSPIEPAWSKIKTLLRSAAARTRETLEAALLPALDAISPQDAAGFFTHCGYILPAH